MKSTQWIGISFWAGGLCFSGAMYALLNGDYVLSCFNLVFAILNTYVGTEKLEELRS